MSRCSRLFRCRYRIRRSHLILLTVIFLIAYVVNRAKSLVDRRYARTFYRIQQQHFCNDSINDDQPPKLILFWTKIFNTPVDVDYLNNVQFRSTGRCGTSRCHLTNDRRRLCASDAVIFHARGGINVNDLPTTRSPHQRYVLLTKEPPYKTTALVGHFDYFFNWTATYRTDSDIDYRYFRWRRKDRPTNETQQSYLGKRQARAASLVSNCYSQNNREEYIHRLQSILPVTRIGHCSWNKCRKTRAECLNDLADTHPFYLAFENSLCRDYVTEKYANIIQNSRMLPVVFASHNNLYIPNSFVDANVFSTPEHLGKFLLQLASNATAYDSYFAWKNEYELVTPDDDDYLCELCRKLHNINEPNKVYPSMEKWLFADAKCQRWISRLNTIIDIPVGETMDYEDPWF